MYKQIKTDKEVILENGTTITPIRTLSDGYGRCQIHIDDHCYVISLRKTTGKYKNTTYIFPEVFEVLKTLPLPK